jgi:RNase H-like domain found in reverse transcriptase/Reverse transcriptase (RNA-dependent DNA polymerase)
VYKNTEAEWASPPLILPKPGPDQYRMTVDLRVPNASTKPTAWPMPNLKNELHNLHVSEVFATLDFCQGYWQIPLHKDSQDCQSFITPDGVYAPTRVLNGTRNATQHLQSVLVVMMDDIKSNIKVWLDDCLLRTKTEDDLLATLNFFFKKCQEHGLKLHARKCVLFASTVRYCGRLITKDDVRFDPKNMEALQTMQEPQNGADLVQYVAAVNWMRSAIPNYSKRLAPLQATLAKVFEGKSRGTKKAAAAVSRLHIWGPEEQATFKDLQAAIMDSMTLAFPDPVKRICVLNDASDRFYAGLLTQIDEEQLDLSMEEQDHQPLAFLSGEFKGAQLRWTVPEKEGFAIVDTVTIVEYLLLSQDKFSILSDNLNSHTFTIPSRLTPL